MSQYNSSPDADRYDLSGILTPDLPQLATNTSAALDDPWGEAIVQKSATAKPAIPTQPPQPEPELDPWDDGAQAQPKPAVVIKPQVKYARPLHAQPAAKPEPAPPQPQPAPTQPAKNAAFTGRDLALQAYKRGATALAAKDYATAKSAFKSAIEWDGQLTIAHSGMARVCTEIKDYEGALAAWDRAIALAPEAIDCYYQRAIVNKILKNYYDVLADCQQILSASPERTDARWLNAITLVKVEQYQYAIPDLDLHIQSYPQEPSGYGYRGICYERLGELKAALADLDRAIEIQANNPLYHHARGRTRHKLGDLQGALADYNIAIARKPQATVYDERAEIQRLLGNHLEALEDCDRAIELNPHSIDTYFRRGLTYQKLGELELALTDFTQVIDLDDAWSEAYMQRAWIYFRQNDYSRAKRDCQRVKALDASNFWAYYLQGVVEIFTDLKHSALNNFTKAIEISPHYVSARYHRSCLYAELGDKTKAAADFEEAKSIQKRGLERLVDRDETGFYAEGMALRLLGQAEAARNMLNLGALAAKRFSNPSFHQRIQQQIEALDTTSAVN